MALKTIYNEVQKNKIKDKKMVYMSLEDFVAEHKDLIRVLKVGSKKELLAEADKQQAELEEETGGETVDEKKANEFDDINGEQD